jgi:hypothetical protein
VSQSFGYIPKSGIAGSNGRSMFRFLRSLQIFFQNGCTSLHSHQQCIRVPFSPHPRQHLLLVVPFLFLDESKVLVGSCSVDGSFFFTKTSGRTL